MPYISYICMANKINITSISRNDFRNILNTLTRFFTFAQTGSSDGFSLEDFDYLKETTFPDKIPEGGKFYIDYPMKYPICVDVIPFTTIYDLFTQIKNILNIVYTYKRKECEIPDYIKFKDLYVEKLTVCTKGDIVVYLKSY